VWLAGYEARTKRSVGVYKELKATCVVFDNGVTRLAFVALDVCLIYGRQFLDLRAAAEKAGIQSQHVMINVSHTHSGPVLDPKKNKRYVALFKSRTDALFEEAVAGLKPAALDYTVGSCAMAINRRRLNDAGKCIGIRPEPRKQIDSDVPVLRVLSPQGKVRAVIFGYACHPVTVGGNHYQIGPDYVGFARDWVAAAYPGCVPVFLQGCGADTMPRWTTRKGRFGYVLLDPIQTMAELGHELGRAVIAALTVPPEAAKVPIQLAGIVEKVKVPDRDDPTDKHHWIHMGAWRVGDVYIFGCRGELGSNIGLRIKRELPGARVWTNGYTHFHGGYILDAASYAEGGYEIGRSAVGPAAEDIVVGNAIRYVRALQAGRTER